MNDYAVMGDPQTCEQLRLALRRQGLLWLDEGELEIQDEWECRRWFARNQVAGVFICTGLLGQTSVANFMFTLAGSLNVIRAAVGNTPRLILVSSFPSAEFYLLNRLVDLYRAEKQLDFSAATRTLQESPEALADRCVLCMQDVSAKEAHSTGTEGPHQGGKVQDQLVPQPASGEGNLASAGERQAEGLPQPSAHLLEVQKQAAERAASGDLRAEQSSDHGPQAAHPLHHHSGSV
jgi:hypothetical protein